MTVHRGWTSLHLEVTSSTMPTTHSLWCSHGVCLCHLELCALLRSAWCNADGRCSCCHGSASLVLLLWSVWEHQGSARAFFQV